MPHHKVSHSPSVGYTISLLHRFPGGTRTVSPVARYVLATVLPYHPPEVLPLRLDIGTSCCLHPERKGSAFGLNSIEATEWFTFVTAR